MSRQAIQTGGAPSALGPYSQAIRSGDAVYCSGQIGIDPVSGELLDGVEAQAERALRNLQSVLDAAGLGFDDVVKTTIFLADVGDFAAVNAIYARFMADPPPARSTIGVAALPKGALIEIEAIAQRVRVDAVSRTPG
jgi:2-iminobutanoate/2-iminopropanoate deaminase